MLGININTDSELFKGLTSSLGANLAGGNNVAQSLGNVASSLVSPYASILGVVGLGGTFQKTFGNILSNGFDVTCWGSSHPPANVKAELSQHYQPYFNTLMSNLQNGDIQSINRFINDVYICNNAALKMQTATKWSKCSAKGVKMYLDFMTPLKQKADGLIDAFIGAGAKKSMKSVSSNFTLISYKVKGGENQTISVPVLSAPPVAVASIPITQSPVVVPKIPVSLSDLKLSSLEQQMIDLTKGLTKQPTFDGGELKNVVVEDKTPKKTDFPWWVLLLGLGMV
ncbi:hypothetical protein D3C85_322450 [compost metagenome]